MYRISQDVLFYYFQYFCCRCFDSGVYSGICHSTLASKLANHLGIEAEKVLMYSVYQPHDLKLHREHKNMEKVKETVGMYSTIIGGGVMWNDLGYSFICFFLQALRGCTPNSSLATRDL